MNGTSMKRTNVGAFTPRLTLPRGARRSRSSGSRFAATIAICAGIAGSFLGSGVASASATPFQLGANMAENVGAPNYCITSLGGGVGTQVVLNTCNSITDQNQAWNWVQGSSGYALQNEGDNLCMSDDGVLGDGAGQYMETCDGSLNQVYAYEPEPHDAMYVSGGQPSAAPYVLTSNGDLSDGANVIEWTPDGSINQSWFLACNGGSCTG